jgi:acid phosphatase type 7
MKNKAFLFVCITLLFCQNLFAGTQYYRLSFRDDPSTTIVVGWSNLGTSTNAQVYYGTTDFGTTY